MSEAKPWPAKWAGKQWSIGKRWGLGGPDVLSESEVRALYDAVPAGKEAMCKALSVNSISVRKADRALQLLRGAGLIVYEGRTWRHA